MTIKFNGVLATPTQIDGFVADLGLAGVGALATQANQTATAASQTASTAQQQVTALAQQDTPNAVAQALASFGGGDGISITPDQVDDPNYPGGSRPHATIRASFPGIGGDPYGNTALAAALNEKAEVLDPVVLTDASFTAGELILTAMDHGNRDLYVNTTGPVTLRLSDDMAGGWLPGDRVAIYQIGLGVPTLAAGTGATFQVPADTTPFPVAQYRCATATYYATDSWVADQVKDTAGGAGSSAGDTRIRALYSEILPSNNSIAVNYTSVGIRDASTAAIDGSASALVPWAATTKSTRRLKHGYTAAAGTDRAAGAFNNAFDFQTENPVAESRVPIRVIGGAGPDANTGGLLFIGLIGQNPVSGPINNLALAANISAQTIRVLGAGFENGDTALHFFLKNAAGDAVIKRPIAAGSQNVSISGSADHFLVTEATGTAPPLYLLTIMKNDTGSVFTLSLENYTTGSMATCTFTATDGALPTGRMGTVLTQRSNQGTAGAFVAQARFGGMTAGTSF